MGDAVSALSRRLLGLGALFVTGLGIKNFTDDVKRLSLELTNLSRAATNAGASAQAMRTYTNVGRVIGVDPSEIVQSMTAMRDQIAQFRVFANGNTAIVQWLSKMGMSAKDFDTPEASENAMRKMNRYAEGMRSRGVQPPEINAFFGAGGFSKGMSALLQLEPKKFDELMSTFKKYAPTADDIEKFKKLTEASAESTAALDKLGITMKAQLAGPLTEFYKWWTSVINYYLAAPKSGEGAKVPNAEGLELPGANVPSQGRGGGWGRLGELYKGSGGYSSLIGPANAALSPSGQPLGSSGINPPGSVGGLAADRAKFAKEMEQKPWLREKVMAIAAAENNNPTANQAVLESMMNRASARGTSLEEAARLVREGRGYYPVTNPSGLQKNRAMIESNLNKVLAGSNVSNYATDNSSGSLAVRDQVSGAFIPSLPGAVNGESFFSPGNRGRGPASRESYMRWLEGVKQSTAANESVLNKTAGGFKLPWISEPGVMSMLKSGSVSTTNNRTNNEVHIGSINTQATDAYGIARDLKPYLENNQTTSPFNYGPN